MERQLARLRSALDAGMPRRGWKIGINVPEVLARAGLAHPGLGWLNGYRVLESGAELTPTPGARLHVEPEVCLHVAAPVAPSASSDEALHCVSGVSPALEVVNYALPSGGLDEIVEHCMFHEACVVGAARSVDTARGLGARWPRLRVADMEPASPRSDLVPSHLGELVVFAATFLEAFGEALEPGDLILSGSYLAEAIALPERSDAHARFGRLGEVRTRAGA
jgi:2-keto-4-pentenoate hydratase